MREWRETITVEHGVETRRRYHGDRLLEVHVRFGGRWFTPLELLKRAVV